MASKLHPPDQLDSLASLDCLAVEAEAVVGAYRTIDQVVADIGIKLSRLEPEQAVAAIDQSIALLGALMFDENSLQTLALRISDRHRCTTREEIGEHIALLLGSFPYSNVPDPDVYTRMMIEEIAAVGPSLMVLDSACRSLRRSLRWLPSIAQVLEIIAVETERWGERLECTRHLVEHHARAIFNLRELRRRMEGKAAESREHLVRRLVALETERDRAEREGRSGGHRWRWEIQWDIDRVRQKLGTS
jgi:hypothetical protein